MKKSSRITEQQKKNNNKCRKHICIFFLYELSLSLCVSLYRETCKLQKNLYDVLCNCIMGISLSPVVSSLVRWAFHINLDVNFFLFAIGFSARISLWRLYLTSKIAKRTHAISYKPIFTFNPLSISIIHSKNRYDQICMSVSFMS